MRPPVEQAHGIDAGYGLAGRELAGGDRIERRLAMPGTQAGHVMATAVSKGLTE
jgi:hypothetical protein